MARNGCHGCHACHALDTLSAKNFVVRGNMGTGLFHLAKENILFNST